MSQDNKKKDEPLSPIEKAKLINRLIRLQKLLWIPICRESRETIESYSDAELKRQVKMHDQCIKDYGA